LSGLTRSLSHVNHWGFANPLTFSVASSPPSKNKKVIGHPMAEKIGLWIPLASSNISNMAGKCPKNWLDVKKNIELNGGFSSMLDETRGVHLCISLSGSL
jgi:hypothetical protein